MSIITSDTAAFVLPVCASFAAVVAAFGAFMVRREAVVVAKRPHTADLMSTTAWSGSGISRNANGTSYDPQSRGSSG
jgi:hypothetical protein